MEVKPKCVPTISNIKMRFAASSCIHFSLHVIMCSSWFYLFSSCPCVSLSLSVSQYKKHRLSLGHTNNYAKSVVNMADMVRILLILFLESLPQALSLLPLSSHSSLKQPHILHLNHFLGHRKLWAAIKQAVWRVFLACWWDSDSICSGTEGHFLSAPPCQGAGLLKPDLLQVIAARWERLCFWKWPCTGWCGRLSLENAQEFTRLFRLCVAHACPPRPPGHERTLLHQQ